MPNPLHSDGLVDYEDGRQPFLSFCFRKHDLKKHIFGGEAPKMVVPRYTPNKDKFDDVA